jgi:hypothetical protein
MPRAALAFVFAAAALGLAPGATANPPNKEQIRFNAADQASARAALLRRADLGPSGWSGGPVKPDLSSTMRCPGYEPKQSDLVLTGAAEADFRHSGLSIQSSAQVLKTRSMVARDWQRTVVAPKAFGCIRSMLTKTLLSNQRLVSFKKLPFPRLTRYAAAYRAMIDFSSQGQHVLFLADIVLVGRSRTELTLSIVAPAAARASISKAEVRLARGVLARVRA